MSQPDPLRGVTPRAYRDLIRKAVAQGWTVSPTGGQHLRLTPPPGSNVGVVIAGFSAHGGRSTLNLRSILRQHGVDC